MSDSDASIETLSQRLRKASRTVHDLSDHLVNARLVVLFTKRELFGRALSSFYFVFVALEDALGGVGARNAPNLQLFADVLPKLQRAKAFAKDLDFYLGPGWQSTLQPAPEVVAYQRHIAKLGASEDTAVLLLAHCYTQCMGVLAGGQIIRRLARKHMRLPEDEGTASFEYEEGISPSQLSKDFKGRMDQLGTTLAPEQVESMISEHCSAFKYNNSIIKGFKIGWGEFVVALFTIMPKGVLVSILLILIAIILWVGMQRWG